MLVKKSDTDPSVPRSAVASRTSESSRSASGKSSSAMRDGMAHTTTPMNRFNIMNVATAMEPVQKILARCRVSITA